MAAAEGSSDSRSCWNICTGTVLTRAEDRKLAITTSSQDAMNAKIKPDSTPGRMRGNVMVMKVETGVAPKFSAASSNDLSTLVRLDLTMING